MAENSQQDRQSKFEEYNPYAVELGGEPEYDSQPVVRALLAVAYEVSRVRTEMHFQGKGRSS